MSAGATERESRHRLAWLYAILVILVVASACSEPRDHGVSEAQMPSPGKISASAPERIVGSYPVQGAFTMMSELSGDSAALAAQYLAWGVADAVSLHAPLSADAQAFVTKVGLPFIFRNTPIDLGACFADEFEPKGTATMQAITEVIGKRAWMLALPEFDQSGGCWTKLNGGRPKPSGTASTTYQQWINFYQKTLGLEQVLGAGPDRRGYQIAATCAYAFCPRYAYELGADLVLLERSNDEVSGITPGMAMARGASVQNGSKPWGIDLSTWRYWSGSPTEYNAQGQLTGGWSTSWFKRLMYIAFMGGSTLNYFESADYTTGARTGDLNPLGLTLKEFRDFAVNRHADRGTPFVPMAIIEEHTSGFEPKFGQYNQGDTSWYSKLNYSLGDRTLEALLQMAFPDYQVHGQLVQGGPKSPADYQRRLAKGEDPRPWEPMGSSRWGESFDVLSNWASLGALEAYRAVVLAQGTPITTEFAETLEAYVRAGGILVMNADQPRPSDETWTGVRLSEQREQSSIARWLADKSLIQERKFTYRKVDLVGATAVAETEQGDALITEQSLGEGLVYVITADSYQDTKKSAILMTGQRLIDDLQQKFAVANLVGPPCEYLVNVTGSKTLVTLVNNNSTQWDGRVIFGSADGQVREYTHDSPVPSSVIDGKVNASISVPAWDVMVFVLDRAA